jgi:hypothetical protein
VSTKARTLALVVGAALALLAALYARGIRVDAGVLGVLPDDVPAVTAWRDALTRFDALDVLLVGLEEPEGGLSVDGLRHVDAVTRRLEAQKEDGVLAVRSVTNVATLREGEGGEVDSGPLIASLPEDPVALDSLKQRVLANAQVLGALVSRDLRGYAVVVRIDPRKGPLAVAAVERAVERERGPLKAYYHGAPFFAAVPGKHILARLPSIALASLVLLFGIFLVGTRRAIPAGWAVVAVVAAGGSLVFGVALVRAASGTLSPASAPLALGWFALAGALFAAAFEHSSLPSNGPARRWPSRARATACVAVIILGGVVASRARVLCSPGELFSREDEAGAALAFFDERFGGADFLQIDFAGDLTNPAVAARLMRLSDLLEGTDGLSDVRSVAQVLAFVNHGFGDTYRIPSKRAALANLWFFLEGNGDVRSLVTGAHDEAMIQIRVPSRGGREIGAITDDVRTAIERSTAQDAAATSLRLEAIARAAGARLPSTLLGDVTAAAARAPSPSEEAEIAAQVGSRLRQILASPDSPYQPSEEEWGELSAALRGDASGLRGRLSAVASSMKSLRAQRMDDKLVDMLVEREGDARIAARSHMLAARLLSANAPALQKGGVDLRAQGALAEEIDPQTDGGKATVTILGFPVLEGIVSSRSLAHVWRALAVVFALGCALVPFLGIAAGVRRLLVAAAGVAVTLLVCRGAGVQMDVGSANLYVVPAVLGIFAPTSRRGSRWFLFALGAALTPLLFTGALPVTRFAAAAAVGLVSVAFVGEWLSERGARQSE